VSSPGLGKIGYENSAYAAFMRRDNAYVRWRASDNESFHPETKFSQAHVSISQWASTSYFALGAIIPKYFLVYSALIGKSANSTL
jgi:hypothetical protein